MESFLGKLSFDIELPPQDPTHHTSELVCWVNQDISAGQIDDDEDADISDVKVNHVIAAAVEVNCINQYENSHNADGNHTKT